MHDNFFINISRVCVLTRQDIRNKKHLKTFLSSNVNLFIRESVNQKDIVFSSPFYLGHYLQITQPTVLSELKHAGKFVHTNILHSRHLSFFF